jgi:hypothetical protein
MIDIFRTDATGDTVTRDGSVLWIGFGNEVIRHIFRREPFSMRFMNTRRGTLPGWAPEDKITILPVTVEQVEFGIRKDLDIFTDPGGDIYLDVSPNAGVGHSMSDGRRWMRLTDISRQPDGLLERGIDTIALPYLFQIEEERQARLRGWSHVDGEWERQQAQGTS